MIQRVPPDYYTHSTLDPKNYFRQCTDFTNSESRWLVLPSTSMSCISEVITRDDLIACRKRIWVVLNRDHKLINEDWVIKQHNNGYFNLAIIKDGQYTIKTAPYNHNIKAVENTKKMTLIWDNEINNANATSELTRISLFKKLFYCTKSSYKKIMPQPNTASTNTNNSNKKW